MASMPKSKASSLEWTAMGEAMTREGWLKRDNVFDQSLLPLLQALNWKGNVRQLADTLPGKGNGLTLKGLCGVMAALGYSTTRHHGRLAGVHHALPCLFTPNGDAQASFVVLNTMEEGGWLVFNLTDSMTRIVTEDDVKGYYYYFEAVDNEHADLREQSWFITTLRRFQPIFREVLWLGPVINIFALVVPFFTMLVYDRVIGAQSPETLEYLLVGAVLALGAEVAFRFIRGIMMARFGTRLNYLVTCGVFERLLSLTPTMAEQASPAGQIARIKTFESVREFFTGQTFMLFVELPFLFIIVAALFLLSPAMAAVALISACCFLALVLLRLRHLRRTARVSARAMAERQAAALEIFTKLNALRANGLCSVMLDRFDTLNLRAARTTARFSFAMHMLEHMASSFGLLGGLAAITMGLTEVWAGILTPGGLIAGMILVWRILGPLQQLAALAPRFEQVGGAIMQIDRLMAVAPELPNASESYQNHTFKGRVDLVNVAMRYGRNDPVFSSITLTAEPGQMVAITGGNGSGKSTLLKLMNGMYQQAVGSIRFDGIDIRQLNPLALRRSVTYIPQTADLFSGTIKENLTLTAPLASNETIREALEAFDAMSDIRALPAGLDTVIGIDGQSLPEIFAFKLVLARAAIDLKPIVLCDELPYALLNSEVGSHFRRFISRLKGQHTIFLVTHTEDHMALADRVLFLKQEQRHAIGNAQKIIPLLKEPRYA